MIIKTVRFYITLNTPTMSLSAFNTDILLPRSLNSILARVHCKGQGRIIVVRYENDEDGKKFSK